MTKKDLILSVLDKYGSMADDAAAIDTLRQRLLADEVDDDETERLYAIIHDAVSQHNVENYQKQIAHAHSILQQRELEEVEDPDALLSAIFAESTTQVAVNKQRRRQR